MKMDRYSWNGVSLLALLLLIPIVIGEVPSLPKKLGHGWSSPISMRDEPRKFWLCEGAGAVVAGVIFAFAAFGRKNFEYHDRRFR